MEPRAPTPSPPQPQPAPVEEDYPPEVLEPTYVNVNVHAQSPPTPPPPAPAPVPIPIIPDPNEEILVQLKAANAEIERLRTIISSMPDPSTIEPETVVTSAPSEFRRRTRAYSDDGSTLAPETDIGSYVDDGIGQPDGVPLQIVIVIALGVFVTTYLFF